MILIEAGLGIEGVHLADATVHEKKDAPLGRGRMMRWRSCRDSTLRQAGESE